MKIIVISEETRQRLLSEDPMLDAIDSSKTKKEKELEKKKKDEELRKKKEEELKKKNEKNDSVTKTETDNNKVDNNKVDNNKVDNNKVDNNKVDDNKVDNNKVDNNKVDNNKVDNNKSTYVQVDQEMLDAKLKADKEKAKTPPKPTNPSGKVIPKPKKPLMKNSPAAKAGIPTETRQKFANMNAAFQATKRKDSGYTKMDFIKDFPNSQTAKKFNKGERIPGFKYPKTKKVKAEPPVNIKDMSAISKPKEVTINDFKSTTKKEDIKSSYEPYHIVLGYLLHEGHADTINEAHYVMTQMDDQTVQEIVALDEGIANTARIVGALTFGGLGLDAIRKQMQNKKKMDQGGKFTPGSTMDNIQKRNEMLKNM